MIIIFEEVVRVQDWDGYDHYQDLYRLISTSKRFADIIQKCPTFWTVICCTNSRAIIKLALARSQGLPLEAKFLCNRPSLGLSGIRKHCHEYIRQMMWERSLRWRSLTLDVNALVHTERYLLEFMPNIRELFVGVRFSGSVNGLATLYEGRAAQLEVLSLWRCRIFGARVELPNLRILTLDCIEEGQMRLEETLQLVLACPKLESLEITRSTFHFNAEEGDRENPIHTSTQHALPEPKSLHISDSLNAHHLACRLHTPKCSNYRMEMPDQDEPNPDVSLLGPWMATISSGLPAVGFHLKMEDGMLILQYAKGDTNIDVVTIKERLTVQEYGDILGGMGEALCKKIDHLTLAERDDFLPLLTTAAKSLPSIHTLSLGSRDLITLDLLSRPDPAMGWLLPLVERINFSVGHSAKAGEDLLGLVRASNSGQSERRPTPLVYARLEYGWI